MAILVGDVPVREDNEHESGTDMSGVTAEYRLPRVLSAAMLLADKAISAAKVECLRLELQYLLQRSVLCILSSVPCMC